MWILCLGKRQFLENDGLSERRIPLLHFRWRVDARSLRGKNCAELCGHCSVFFRNCPMQVLVLDLCQDVGFMPGHWGPGQTNWVPCKLFSLQRVLWNCINDSQTPCRPWETSASVSDQLQGKKRQEKCNWKLSRFGSMWNISRLQRKSCMQIHALSFRNARILLQMTLR